MEQGTVQELRAAKAQTKTYLKYYWDFYSELAYQRAQIEEQLKQALNESCRADLEFKQWQCAVKYKYSLHPLSAIGSTKGIGGRFNVGGDINPNIPVFSALYITEDKDTALQETLGQIANEDSNLSPQELALANPQSESIISASGKLDHVLDLSTAKSLSKFIRLIKDFKLPGYIFRMAKALGADQPVIVRTPGLLRKSLLGNDWRHMPMLYDVPSNSQVFGHLVYQAKIEGILYPSKLTKKQCLAIFPRNFENTSSYIQLDDSPAHEKTPTRLDSRQWRLSELIFSDLD